MGIELFRNQLQALVSCIPGCFRLAHTNFIRIEDVSNKEYGKDPVVLYGPENIDNFSVNSVSWRYIWNDCPSVDDKSSKFMLPIIEENQFVGKKTKKECMYFCETCWDYFPNRNHEHKTQPVFYNQNPARVKPKLVPEFSYGSLYNIIKNTEYYSFDNKEDIMNLFKGYEQLFDKYFITVLESDYTNTIMIGRIMLTTIGNDFDNLNTLLDRFEEFSLDKFNEWIINNFSGEIKFKELTHSKEIAKSEGDAIFKSQIIQINYSTDINIIRYVTEIERHPYSAKPRFDMDGTAQKFNEINIPFKNRKINCIATSSRVECLIITFDDNIGRITKHTYLHALIIYLSLQFKVSQDLFYHYLDDNYCLIFIDQPLNLGLLMDIGENHIVDFHEKYCNGSNMCSDEGICQTACHNCLHFPRFLCSNYEDMEKMKWDLLGTVEW